jgi:serine/threonine protein kinase
LFAKILDGVEAAHLQKVVHRDLKPENILLDAGGKTPAIADFGIAKFTEDLIATLVETSPAQRLANFQYAAPEQRIPGKEADVASDLYALGLMLNEMYTGAVPHGTDFKTIASVFPEMGFLDEVVAKMLKQQPQDRPKSIAEIKALIQRHQAEAVSLQKLSKIDNTVIPVGEVDDPLAFEPPKLVNAEWDGQRLTLTLDRPVSQAWADMLRNPNWSHTAVWGKGPETFSVTGNRASVSASEHEVQQIIDHFKSWLAPTTQRLRQSLENAILRQEHERKESLLRERQAEERRLNVMQNLRI